MWISQMMALLDKPEGSTVHHILTELAENYPQVCIVSQTQIYLVMFKKGI
jgi:hypothetical protein